MKETVLRNARSKLSVALHDISSLTKTKEIENIIKYLVRAIHDLDHEIALITELKL